MASWTRESGTSECMETIKEEKGRFDEWKLSARVFFANRTAVAGLVIFLLFVGDAIIVEVAPGLVGVQYPDSVAPPLFSITHPECVNQAPEPPSFAHPFGTTEYGVPGGGRLDHHMVAAVRSIRTQPHSVDEGSHLHRSGKSGRIGPAQDHVQAYLSQRRTPRPRADLPRCGNGGWNLRNVGFHRSYPERSGPRTRRPCEHRSQPRSPRLLVDGHRARRDDHPVFPRRQLDGSWPSGRHRPAETELAWRTRS